MLKVIQMIFNNFDENTYLLVDSATGDAAVVDPGMLTGQERLSFDNYIKENNIRLTQIILTHGHVDHCFGADYVRTRYGAPVKAHADDIPLTDMLGLQAERFGMGKHFPKGISVDVLLKDGDSIEIGQSRLEVIHVPGHSPGGIALYDKADGYVISGDSLFRGSIGRTDLPGGNHATLVSAVRDKLLSLPDDTMILPGHGDFTRVGIEKKSNPYLV